MREDGRVLQRLKPKGMLNEDQPLSRKDGRLGGQENVWGTRPSLTLVSNVWVAVESSIQVKVEQSESNSSRGMMERTAERETVL